ncbi:5'-methylthioadenosine/S-adenosylhomocysteine nucleosidase [Streptomyces antimycoticus]
MALGLTSKGNHSAAVLAERAIEHFSPAAVLFVGVAGRMRSSIALGDVVMATYVYAYHGATSEDDGLKARPRVWEAAHPIIQLGQHLARMTDRAGHAPENGEVPRVHFGPIAAGEVLQNSRNSAEAAWLRQHYNDAFAIDMEAAGVAQAGHRQPPVGRRHPAASVTGRTARRTARRTAIGNRAPRRTRRLSRYGWLRN